MMKLIDVSVEGGIARLMLNSPPLNILTRALLAELRAALRQLSATPDVRVLLLAAHGRHFSAGAAVDEHLRPECDVMIPEFNDTVLALYNFRQPVIAAVQGRCLGGGFELVQAADIIVAADTAVFGQPEIQLGVFPPAACALLPQHTSRGVTAELIFSGDPITAADAHAAGIVRRVVDEAQLLTEAGALAARIARHSAAALALTRRALQAPAAEHMARSIAHTSRIYLDELMRTQDANEGLRAFLDKRSPAWSHQ